MHDLIVAAMQENWAIIKTHLARMVTIFEVLIREGIEAGEFEVEDPAEAALAVKTAFTPFFHPILIETAFNAAKTPKRGCASRFALSKKLSASRTKRAALWAPSASAALEKARGDRGRFWITSPWRCAFRSAPVCPG